MNERHAEQIILDNLIFPEGLRWHDGHLWFCDVETHEVITADGDGVVQDRKAFPGEHPIGLAWTPNGELIVGGRFERLLTYRDGKSELLQDLRADGTDSWSNDTVIDAAGRTYLASFGKAYDLEDHPSNERRLKGAGRILLRGTDGIVREVAKGLSMPNTMQITADENTLICSDSMAHRIVSYDIHQDGTLGPEMVYAEFECYPDGSTLDVEGGLWVALPSVQQARRLVNGEVTDVVHFDGEVFDVALGGPNRTSLYAAVSNLQATTPPTDGQERSRPGRIYRIEVDVPAAR